MAEPAHPLTRRLGWPVGLTTRREPARSEILLLEQMARIRKAEAVARLGRLAEERQDEPPDPGG